MNTPRGIRCNNPGNLILSKIPWKGKIPNDQNVDGKFEQFIDIWHGIRASIIDLRHDMVKDNQRTIKVLFNEYAPDNENSTKEYIEYICKAVGFTQDEELTPDKETIDKILMAAFRYENGGVYVNQEDMDRAWELV